MADGHTPRDRRSGEIPPPRGDQDYMNRERHRAQKRRRESEPAPVDDLDKSLLASLIHVCNLPMAEDQPAPEEQLDSLVRTIVRGVERGPQAEQRQRQTEGLIIGCATEMSHKTPVYAAVLGLVSTEEPEFVQGLVRRLQQEFDAALAQADRHKARMLLRFMAALVPVNVLHPSSVLKAMQSVVDAAKQIVEKGGTEDEQRVWQPYTDFLVYIVLMGLPWGGAELAESVPADVQQLLAGVEAYMGLRPRSHQPALRPFFEGDDEASSSDSGGASFLGQVWEAVQEMQSGNAWKVANIPVHVTKENEVRLASGQPHNLPALAIPLAPPGIPIGSQLSTMEAAANVLAAFPPRGVIRMLPPEHTMGGKPKMERLVAEEYILDTIHFYNGDRVECARTLATGLPLPIKYESLLAEVLFSQMLRVPSPHLKPIAYSTIMVDVCKLMQTFPRSMSACVRECFTRMAALDPQLRVCLADWLAYHLSNFDFMWPWAKWSHVLDAPSHDAQRRFVVATLSKLIRLSYWGNVQSKVPEAFRAIVPPKPLPQPLVPAAEAGPESTPKAGDGQDEDTATEPAAEGARDNGNGASAAPAPDQQGLRAAEFVEMIRSKASSQNVLDWIAHEGLEEELGGKAGVLCMVLRALLVAGSKSFTHMITALERYDELLMRLLPGAGAVGQKEMVRTTAEVWRDAPQRAAQAIDRLMAHRVVDGLAILRWAFESPGLVSLQDELATGLAWEAIYNAVNKTLARTQDARDELAAAQRDAGVDSTQASANGGTASAEVKAEVKPEEDLPLQVEDTTQQARLVVLQEKVDLLKQAQQDQRDLFLLAFELFRDVLESRRAQMTVGDDEDAEAAEKEWQSFMIASLRAFTRRYYMAAAALAPVLEGEIFAEGKEDNSLRQAFVESLHI